MSKQSSVEWLIEQIDFDANTRWFSQPEWFAIFEKSKAMHRKEIEDAYIQSMKDNMIAPLDFEVYKPEAEEYYKGTFGDEEVL